MDRLARRHGPGLALGLVLAGLLALVLLLALGTVGPDAALAHYSGTGLATTPDQQLTEGWYEVSWTARAADRPEQGCLFGLRIEERRSDASPDMRERRRFLGFFWPGDGNLVYRTLPRNSALSGSSGPLELEPGVYGFVVDGWCAWDVSLSPIPVGARPSPDGGPRM